MHVQSSIYPVKYSRSPAPLPDLFRIGSEEPGIWTSNWERDCRSHGGGSIYMKESPLWSTGNILPYWMSSASHEWRIFHYWLDGLNCLGGLYQSVWAVQRMQQRGAEGSGEEGGVSSTWPTIKDSEERKKSRWKCFEATLRAMYTSRHQNLDQVFLIDATIILVVNM